ncbi:substrate-binding periplasmic protein [Pseudomonas typographi]|uniref:substrate-binding periplasmic protein n=1 Tax=Pseudomonas typographi TaxID=2715964 RepID=UPI00168A3101|nr:ABC transporter substrate-binding protein [Pseudomonas typographi]MBD1589455.1 ABC transporter substrate-binding protein [Pseudomonas typographi]
MRLLFRCLGLVLGLCASATLLAAPLLGVTEESSYAYVRDGQIQGPAVRVVQAVLARAGITDYQLAIYPWARAYDLALGQPNVVIFPIVRTPARERSFHWVGEFARTVPTLYRLRSNAALPFKALADARDYSIAVVRDDIREHYLLANGFTRLVETADNSETFRRLLGGQVQIAAMSPSELQRRCDVEQVACDQVQAVLSLDEIAAALYIALSRNTPNEVVVKVTAAFNALQAEGAIAPLLRDEP